MREYVSGLCKTSPNSIITLFFAKDFTPNEQIDDSDDQRKSREPTWACPVTVGHFFFDAEIGKENKNRKNVFFFPFCFLAKMEKSFQNE